MSARPGKKTPPRKTPAAKNDLRLPAGLNRRLVVAGALLVFVGIPFALGKYFEFSCPDAFDGGSYAYSAQHILSGARIGTDEKPSAQPGTLLVNILGVEMTGYNETGAKIIQMLLQAAALTVMFLTVRRLNGTLAAVVSVIVTAIYVSAPVIAKTGNVKEQYMIAFMVMGICCFVFYELTGRWWWAVLTGALLLWGPLFKPTAISAILAVGLFVLLQPLLRHAPWRKVGKDVLLLCAGVVVMLAPLYAWYAKMKAPVVYWPYVFLVETVFAHTTPEAAVATPAAPATPAQVATPPSGKPQAGLFLRLMPGYVRDSWQILDPAARKEAVRRVLRYWGVLILPIALALGALVLRMVILLRGKRPPREAPIAEDPGRFVPLFGLWWFFDMACIFVSPHSYEQYYLPLNASGAMLGSYLVGVFAQRWTGDRDRARWHVLGLLGLIAMIVMVWPIFFGISYSPFSGTPTGQPSRGYVQKWEEVRSHPQYAWQQVGRYMREHSEPNDAIYVWGWVPGIYVEAQRMSSAPKAFEGTMHTLAPQVLAARVQELVAAFQKRPPKFMVDTHKVHFPWDRPPLELWPSLWNGLRLLPSLPEDRNQWPSLMLRTLDLQPGDLTRQGFVRADLPEAIRRQDMAYEDLLRKRVGPDEAQRYEAMQPLRQYLTENYQIVSDFGGQVLFQHK